MAYCPGLSGMVSLVGEEDVSGMSTKQYHPHNNGHMERVLNSFADLPLDTLLVFKIDL